MNQLQQRMFSQEATEGAPAGRTERRREPRETDARPVYLQPAGADGKRFEEVRTMNNFSRSGFYFITHRESYHPGMELFVIPAFGCFNFEYEAEVVRVESLPFGEFGVAVRLKRIGSLIVNARSAAKSAFQAFALLDPVKPVLTGHESEG
jgi:hypothetical protein